MSITKRLRFEILRRGGYRCYYCGATGAGSALTVDHVVPVALGGTDEPSNLVTACADCNSGKSATPADAETVAEVAADAQRWADAVAQAARERQEAAARWDDQLATFWDYWTKYNPQWAWPSADWERTVTRFLVSGLSLNDVLSAADVAMNQYGVTQRNRYRYFCGVCNNMLRDLQQAARKIIEKGDA